MLRNRSRRQMKKIQGASSIPRGWDHQHRQTVDTISEGPANLLASGDWPTSREELRSSIWVVNHYANFPGKDQSEGRHFALARYLKSNGWDSSIIASGTSHPSGDRRLPWWQLCKRGVEADVHYLWIGTPGYRSNGASRIVNMLCFTVSVLLPGRTRSLPAPDVVIGSTVHPFAAWAALRLARRKGVPFIFEIRDVWPETLIDFGHWQANGWKARSVRKLMMHLVRESVMVLSPLPGIPLYLEQIGEAKKPFLWISNGAETHQACPTRISLLRNRSSSCILVRTEMPMS